MTEQEVKDDLWLHFGKWFYGQTGLVINGKFVYFKSDIERYKKGLPVVD